MWFPILITIFASYLLGNLNGAFNMSYLLSEEDVRKKGSGNAGLTNFVRNFGVGKAFCQCLFSRWRRCSTELRQIGVGESNLGSTIVILIGTRQRDIWPLAYCCEAC